MSVITGKRIRQDLPETDSLENDDLFLVSEPTDKNNLFYDNKSIDYWNLYVQMCGELSSKYRFKSMAWEDENGYSLSNHNHNGVYAKTTFEQVQKSGEKIATFITRTIDENRKQTTTETEMKFPEIVVYHQDEPYIGEIKFITSTKNLPSNIDVDDSKFDGWVYPNGRTITCKADEFLSACYVFADNSAATSFTVPNLTTFFKGNNTSITTDQIPKNEVIKQHQHNFDLKFKSQNLQTQIKIASSKDFTVGPLAHNLSGKKTYSLSGLKLKITGMSFPRGTTTGGLITENGETHPTYNYMPIMIYIGKKTQK